MVLVELPMHSVDLELTNKWREVLAVDDDGDGEMGGNQGI